MIFKKKYKKLINNNFLLQNVFKLYFYSLFSLLLSSLLTGSFVFLSLFIIYKIFDRQRTLLIILLEKYNDFAYFKSIILDSNIYFVSFVIFTLLIIITFFILNYVSSLIYGFFEVKQRNYKTTRFIFNYFKNSKNNFKFSLIFSFIVTMFIITTKILNNDFSFILYFSALSYFAIVSFITVLIFSVDNKKVLKSYILGIKIIKNDLKQTLKLFFMILILMIIFFASIKSILAIILFDINNLILSIIIQIILLAFSNLIVVYVLLNEYLKITRFKKLK